MSRRAPSSETFLRNMFAASAARRVLSLWWMWRGAALERSPRRRTIKSLNFPGCRREGRAHAAPKPHRKHPCLRPPSRWPEQYLSARSTPRLGERGNPYLIPKTVDGPFSVVSNWIKMRKLLITSAFFTFSADASVEAEKHGPASISTRFN